jgi:hypothetical protein
MLDCLSYKLSTKLSIFLQENKEGVNVDGMACL